MTAPGAAPKAAPQKDAPYEDILPYLKSADGVVGIISRHKSNGMLTFTILREYSQYGDTKRTGFFPAKMFESYRKMVFLVQDRITELQEADLKATEE